MKQPLVSIITPVFNGYNYLLSCLDSILSQSYPYIEWVIINDGSFDSSAILLDELRQKYPFIKVLHQENLGAAEARIQGAKKSLGDYLVYLDIDDTLSSDAISSALKKFNQDIDVVMFTQLTGDTLGYTLSPVFTSTWPQLGIDVFKACIDGWGAHSCGVYRKSLFLATYKIIESHHLLDKNYKDELLTRLIFLLSRQVQYCDGVYYYHFNKNSISHRVNSTYYLIVQNAYSLQLILDSKGLKISIERLYARLFFDLISRGFKWRKQLDNKADWINMICSLTKHVSIVTDIKRNILLKKYILVLPRVLILSVFTFLEKVRK